MLMIKVIPLAQLSKILPKVTFLATKSYILYIYRNKYARLQDVKD